jgi:hypothetical protein
MGIDHSNERMEAMTAIVLTENNLALVKSALRECLCEVKSSHISEALAAALGHRTHAALLAHIQSSDLQDPEIFVLRDAPFLARLESFGFKPNDEERELGFFEFINIKEKDVLINTVCDRAYEYPYTSKRHKAWRNLMVAAVNAGIEQKFFSVKENDNRWPDAQNDSSPAFVYRFEFLGMPAIASVRDIRWGELSIHAALKPGPQAERRILAYNAGFWAGDAFGACWLERKKGAWIQSAVNSLRIRKTLLDLVANAEVWPKGFGDRGRVLM